MSDDIPITGEEDDRKAPERSRSPSLDFKPKTNEGKQYMHTYPMAANYHGESENPRFNFEDFNFVTTHTPMQERGAKYRLEEY